MLGHHEIRVEYLGIVLDKGMAFAAEIQRTSEKTKKTMSALKVLLPNINEPGADNKAVMCAATLSILLYGAAIWQEAMNVEGYKGWVMRAQRPMRVMNCVRRCSAGSARDCSHIPTCARKKKPIQQETGSTGVS